MPLEPTTISALIKAGGILAAGLGGGIMQSQRERDKLRRETALQSGRTQADIALEAGKARATGLANLIEAYRSAMLK